MSTEKHDICAFFFGTGVNAALFSTRQPHNSTSQEVTRVYLVSRRPSLYELVQASAASQIGELCFLLNLIELFSFSLPSYQTSGFVA